jgi:hypothetical protein
MHDYFDVQRVLSQYVRAHDRRDGHAMAALFVPEGRVTIVYNNAGELEPLGELVGRQSIVTAVAQMMKPHPKLGWSHNSTDSPIVDVVGDSATLDAQFMVFTVLGATKPDAGWPPGTSGAQGSIAPIESGTYRLKLVRNEGTWLIDTILIIQDLPLAF